MHVKCKVQCKMRGKISFLPQMMQLCFRKEHYFPRKARKTGAPLFFRERPRLMPKTLSTCSSGVCRCILLWYLQISAPRLSYIFSKFF